MIDLEELKRLAREAQAPVERNGRIDPEAYGANNAFRSLANPAAVLALIERVERAERELSSVESVLNARGSTRAFHLMTVVERVDALAEKAERVSRLDALARKGLEAYHHGEACPFAFSTRPGNPSECENEACREWAKALEEGK